MEATTIQTSLPEDEGMIRLTTANAQKKLSEIVQQVAADDKRIILLQDGKEKVS